MSDFVTRLARKWCLTCEHEMQDDRGCLIPHVHEHIAAAIREALEEAEKVVASRGCTKVACGPSGHSYFACPQSIAAALAALRKKKQ